MRGYEQARGVRRAGFRPPRPVGAGAHFPAFAVSPLPADAAPRLQRIGHAREPFTLPGRLRAVSSRLVRNRSLPFPGETRFLRSGPVAHFPASGGWLIRRFLTQCARRGAARRTGERLFPARCSASFRGQRSGKFLRSPAGARPPRSSRISVLPPLGKSEQFDKYR